MLPDPLVYLLSEKGIFLTKCDCKAAAGTEGEITDVL